MLKVFNAPSEPVNNKFTILAVDDSRYILSIIKSVLKNSSYADIDTCGLGAEALEKCRLNEYDIIIVDYIMPEMDGISFVRHVRMMENYNAVPIIMVTSDVHRQVRHDALAAGVTDFLNKPFDPLELQARVSNMLALRLAQKKLARLCGAVSSDVERAAEDIALREKEMIWCLSLAIDMRDASAGDHISRMARISRSLANGLGLSVERCQLIFLAAPLHDVGKLGVHDSITSKPGKLTEREMQEMRLHAGYGERILGTGQSDLLRIAAAIAGGHHEKWDGSGYPLGLSGEAIPIEARIAAIADVVDALCSARSYKPAWSFEQAYAKIVAESGTHFDPTCVKVFKRLKSEIRQIIRGTETADELGQSEPGASSMTSCAETQLGRTA
jgi:putative two-component system response regulator